MKASNGWGHGDRMGGVYGDKIEEAGGVGIG